MPPLIIEPHDVDRAIAILEAGIKQVAALGN
jgi:4-aminobutyrate aminotransferase-like enzyme